MSARALIGVVAAAALALTATGCGGGRPSRPAAAATAPVAGTPSAAEPGVNRCVAVTRDLAAPGPYAVRRAAATLARRSAVARGPRRIDPTVWYPAGRPPRGCRFPLILFSHGNNGSPSGCSMLCSHLATHGFVVLAPTHPDRRTRRPAQGTERVEDLFFLLAHLPAVWRRLAPRLAGRVDGRAVGVAGHSFGGRTGTELASQDDRVKVLMAMAGGADDASTALVHAPTLMVAGGADTVDPPRLSAASYRALPRATPRALLVVAGAGHGAFVDGCAAARVCPVMRRAAAALFITYLGHRRDASAPLDPARLDDPRLRLTTAGMP
jgi:predicted dienelactone hydrolase